MALWILRRLSKQQMDKLCCTIKGYWCTNDAPKSQGRCRYYTLYNIQDNARYHTSRVTQVFKNSNDLNSLKWSVNSPDINIMEKIWKLLSDIV